MEFLLQGIGLGSILIFGGKTIRRFKPYFFQPKFSLLREKYNHKGDNFVLITGASDGIGKQFAKVFAQQNVNVLLHGRNAVKLKAVKEEILADSGIPNGLRVEIVEIDLSLPPRSIEEIAKTLLAPYNISILINNAGISSVAGVKDEKLEDIEKLFNTNVFSLMALTKYCIAEQFNQEKQNYGFINVGSIVGDFPPGYLSVYATSKSAVKTFSSSIRSEVTPNIQVTCLQPYYVSTKMTGYQKLSFDTISTEEFTHGAINAFLSGQSDSCASLKHELISLWYSLLPSSILLPYLTSPMRLVAEFHQKKNKLRLAREAKGKGNHQSKNL